MGFMRTSMFTVVSTPSNVGSLYEVDEEVRDWMALPLADIQEH
jgi:hypothetical protein